MLSDPATFMLFQQILIFLDVFNFPTSYASPMRLIFISIFYFNIHVYINMSFYEAASNKLTQSKE